MDDKLIYASTFDRLNDIKILDYGNDRCLGELIISEKALNPYGSVHGGLVFTLCDSTACLAAHDGKGYFVTQSANISYLAPAFGTKLSARAKVLHKGKQICVVQVEVYSDKQNLVASAQVSLFRVMLENIHRPLTSE